MLTRKDLERFAPRPRDAGRAAIWEGYIGAFIERGEEFCAEFGIDEQLELVHCLAQMAHETGGFTILWESGAYSAQRIMEIFGVGRHSARVTEAEAERIGALHGEDRAKALFERVYGLGNPSKAKELGNTEPGDGYRYRGCGPNQLTGRRDHERLLHGDYSYPSILRGSFSEFVEKGCLPLAMNDDIKQITRLINGGYNGLASRREWLAKSKKVWPKFPGDTPHKPPEQQKTMVTSKEGNVQVVNGTMVKVLSWYDNEWGFSNRMLDMTVAMMAAK